LRRAWDGCVQVAGRPAEIEIQGHSCKIHTGPEQRIGPPLRPRPVGGTRTPLRLPESLRQHRQSGSADRASEAPRSTRGSSKSENGWKGKTRRRGTKSKASSEKGSEVRTQPNTWEASRDKRRHHHPSVHNNESLEDVPRYFVFFFLESAQKVVLVMSCVILIHKLSTSTLAKQGSRLVHEALIIVALI